MSAMQKVKDALLKAGFSGENSRECAEGGEKTPRSPHVAMDFVRRALDAAAPWWQSQGAEPKDGERIVNSPVESETRPTALGAGKRMEAMQRKAGSRPPIGELPDTAKGMGEDGVAMDANAPTKDAGKPAAAPSKKDGMGKVTNAELLSSDIAAHDRKYHHGNYQGGKCNFRDKVAKTAEQLGVSRKQIKNLNGSETKAGSEEDYVSKNWGKADYNTPEFQAYEDKKKDIAAQRDAALKGAKTDEERAKINEEYDGKFQTAKFEFFTEALKLTPEEAGACAGIAQKMESDNPAVAAAAQEAVQAIAENKDGTAKPKEQAAAQAILAESKKKSEKPEDGETPAPETAEGTEEAPAPAEGPASAGKPAESGGEPDDGFADELKKAFPDKAQMIDKLSQNFDTLNDLLDDEQKKKFWELNEGGDEAAFYTFLGDECGFSAEEVSALRDLTDAYRAANPNDYPEYAEQHKNDELLARVKKADRRLNNDVKRGLKDDKQRGRLSGIKNRLEIKGFSNEEIEQYMDAMGLTEEQKFAVMNDLPIPPKVPTPEEIAQKKAELAAAEKMDAYHKAHDQASKDKKLGDPETAQKLNDLFKDAMEAQKAAKNPATTAPSAAPEQETTSTSEGTASAETAESGGVTEGGNAPTPTAKATKEEVAAQPKEDPVKEDTTPEDHAKVCKANPKSNCPFLKAHMSKEALAALDKPKGAQTGATGETTAPAPATGETSAPATGTAQPAAEPTASAVPPDSSGGETATPAETAEPTAAPAAETEAPADKPEPLPEYTPPEGVELDYEEKGALDELRQAYQDSKDPEEQESLKGLYDTMTGELQSRANALLAQQQVENDPAAQAMEQKQPGFMQNMKDFFGGIAKAWKDPKVDVDYVERAQLGLPKDGDIRRSEYLEAKMRAKKKQDAARLAAYEARENAKLDAAEKKSGGGGEGDEDDSDVEEPKVTREYTDGATPTTDIYEPLPPEQTDTTFGEDLQKDFKNELQRLGVNANIVARKDGPSMVEFEVKRDPSLSENDFKKKLKELSQNLGRTFAFESSQSRGNGKAFTGYVRVTNPKPKDAFARRLLEAPGSIEKAQKMAVPFLAGETPDGEAEWVDLGEHGFIGGDSGGGKTFRIRGGLAGMLHVKSPNQLKVMINAHANAGDYADLEGDPHITGIADSVEKVRANLEEANREWKRRSALFKRAKVNNLDAYNKKMVSQGTPEKQLPVQLVITEEVTNLLQEDPSLAKEIKKIVTNGRKFGVCHLGITQDLRAENIPSDIKGAVRMGVKATTSKKAGEMIFGTNSVQPELESLDGKGGIMVQTPEGIKRLRGTYATAKDIAHLVDYNKRTFQKTNATDASSPSAQPRKLKMPNGIEMETTADGKRKYTYGGKEYVPKMLISNGKKQQVWVRADGSDKTFYTFDNRPAT